MNKHYSSALACLLLAATAVAQQPGRSVRTGCDVVHHNDISAIVNADRAIIWQDDFADPSNWEISHEPTAFNLDWQIGIGLESTGTYGTPAIQSTTAANGYAMICSDCGQNENGDTYEKSYLTTADPIDLSAYPNVILEFQTMYRRYNNEQAYVAISTDGVSWPQPPSDTATVGLPANLYPVWYDNELVQGVAVPNPTIQRINISATAGGQSTVYVRFYWYGIWGYAWYVDDVNIFEQHQYDVGLESSYISHTGTGDEFGRVPEAHLGTELNVGGEVTNFGINPQTGVVVHVETRDASNTVVLTHNSASFDLGSEESTFIDDVVSISGWTPGLYSSNVWVTSNESASDGDIVNDTLERVFEVTEDVYSLDGFGVYPDDDQILSSTGTNSFTDNSDNIHCLTNYFVEQNLVVYGIEVGVTTSSVPGAILVAGIHDSTNVYADDVFAPYITSTEVELTQAHIDANSVIIPFTSPYTMEPGLGYYAGVELLSDGNANDVRILDDMTIVQPSISSMIYLPNGTPNGSFTNGNAFVIRLLSDPTIGMNEREELTGVSMFPNPTTGLLNLILNVPGDYQVEVINAMGELVARHSFKGTSMLNMSELARGTYSVRISNEVAATVQRVTLN